MSSFISAPTPCCGALDADDTGFDAIGPSESGADSVEPIDSSRALLTEGWPQSPGAESGRSTVGVGGPSGLIGPSVCRCSKVGLVTGCC